MKIQQWTNQEHVVEIQQWANQEQSVVVKMQSRNYSKQL